MKNLFWMIISFVLFLLSASLIYSLRNNRNTHITRSFNEHLLLQEELNHLLKNNELKYLAAINSYNKCIEPNDFSSILNDTTVYIRIHDSICLPCTSEMFGYIIDNYVYSSDFNFYVIGSYSSYNSFIGDIQKMGLQDIKSTNFTEQREFLQADTLNLPYLFTLSNSKISSLMLLSETKQIEIDAYFEMLNRTIHF